jgi:hypothetical protein
MKIITFRKAIHSAFALLCLGFCLPTLSQNITVNQDPKFEQLLNEKRKINTSLNINDSYKIQIFNGNNENAKKTLNEFKKSFTDIDATIIFNTPNYKVWVGNFKTRIEAENYLIDIKKKYKNLLLIKPNK